MASSKQLTWNGKTVRMGLINKSLFTGICSNKISADELLQKFIDNRKPIAARDDCMFSRIKIGPTIITAYIYEYDNYISIENIDMN